MFMSAFNPKQRASSPQSVNRCTPPDGESRTWMPVIGGHFVFMNTWGVINSFGVFQTYYTSVLARPPSAISWIGSLQVFLLFFIGALTGRLTDMGHFRSVFTTGSILIVGGHLAASWATQYWQLLIAQGLCVGIGNGCLFNPGLAVLTTYFTKRMGIAVALASAGSATGGLVYPSMVRQLLPLVGIAWTMRCLALLQFVTILTSNILLQARNRTQRTSKTFDWEILRQLEFTFFATGGFLGFWGVYIVFYFLASYSKDKLLMSYQESLNLLLVLNGAGAIGRLSSGYIGDRFGVLNMFIPTTFATGVLVFCWIAVRSIVTLYVWTCAYGIAAGGFQALFPACLGAMSSDVTKRGTLIGMVSSIVSFAVLTGSPIAGALLEALDGSYYGAQVFAASSIVVGSGFLALSRRCKLEKEEEN